MINIDQITQEEPQYPFIYKYRFPTIDFKFQNTGTATALLWQFVIHVIRADIDRTPTFDFYMKVKDRTLQITAINSGWGTANDCLIQIDEPTLNRLFSERDRRFHGIIQSGEERQILTLMKEHAQQNKFETLRGEFSDIRLPTGIPIGVYGIELEAPQATWTCKDDKNKTSMGNAKIWKFNQFFLVENGFEEEILSGGGLPSDATFSSIIDASMGPQERIYPISRKIPPGDVERFHIMIGSPISCYLLLKFIFRIDKSTTIESEMFDVQIWNPRNSGWQYQYKDGEELRRDIEQWQNGSPNPYLYPWEPERLEYLKEQLENYPFIKRRENPTEQS